MTTATIDAPSRTSHRTRQPGRVTFAHLIRSEWIKLVTLRSTWWTLAITVLAMIGMAAAIGSAANVMADAAGGGAAATAGIGETVMTFGYFFGQVTVAVLGALIVTGEYSTGMIRSTFAAAPGRIGALLAKASVLAVVVLVVGVVGVLLSYLVTYPMLSGNGMAVDLGEAETWRVILGAGLYLMLVSLLAFALGTIVRNSAGTIAAVLGVLLMVPLAFQILTAIGQDWAVNVSPYLPSAAGERLMSTGSALETAGTVGTTLEWWQGGLVLAGYVAVLLVVGLTLAKKRDA
ncbi:ABC transporter permease [Miniimonas arenae]|uniref:ABC transporter permease n=1 Tax=Miniimonas arenae TaxID=676201 RepID=A0A5C5BBX8_9MICO|nr:ABC transporter permease subunit [Miniimonas arenae]TNU74759.1 ABC transporter permease [Miniimonas arenae]